MIKRLYSACWYLVGGLILLAAVSITIIRLLLPGIDTYREEIEDLAKHYSGYPISIDTVDAEWRGWQPHLFLEGVVLHEPDKQQPIATFRSAKVSFALLASLIQRQVIPTSLTVSGVNLKLIRGTDGSIRFSDENIPRTRQADESRINEKLTYWLLSQPLIILQDATIIWIDKMRDQSPLRLSQASFNLRTWRQQIQIDGSAKLPHSHGESVNFALDITGNLFGGSWSGQAYFNVNNLEPAAWPHYNSWRNISIVSGDADIDLWSRWKDARLVTAEGRITGEDTLLHSSRSSSLLRELDVGFELDRRQDDSWTLHTRLRHLSTGNGNWPQTDLRVTGKANKQIESLYISHLRLEDVLPLSGLHQLLSQNLKKQYHSDAFRGMAKDISYQRTSDNRDWRVSGQFSDLELVDRQGRSLVSSLQGTFISDSGRGRVVMKNSPLNIDNPSIFQIPLENLSIDGSINWHRRAEQKILVTTDGLDVGTTPHDLSLRGNMLLDSRGLPQADIIASVSSGDTEPLKRFIPSFAKDKLKRWIRQSIVSGNMEYAGLVLRGDLDDFPFDNNEGQFKLNARFNRIAMDYDEEWPPVYQVDGDLSIDRDTLSVRIPSADLYQSRIRDVNATINNLYEDDHILNINGRVTGSTDDAIKFLKNSPLRAKNTLKRLFDLEIDGDINITLNLLLRLFPDSDDDASGSIELLGNNINAPGLGIELNDTSGHITFADDKIKSEGLSASYFGMDVDLEINRNGDSQNGATVLSMTGELGADMLIRILGEKMPADAFNAGEFGKRLNGRTSWKAELESYAHPDAIETLTVNSDLEGLAIDLPAPLDKQQNTKRNLRLDFTLPPKHKPIQKLQLKYGDTMSAYYNNQGLNINLGDTSKTAPIPRQISISGQTNELELDSWLRLLQDQSTLTERVTSLETPWSFNIDLQTERLTMYGQTFNASRLTLVQSPDRWELNFTGSDIEGHISIPEDPDNQTATAKFKHLKLTAMDKTRYKNDRSYMDPRDFPALSINIRDFIYDNTEFGTFSLQADKVDSGLRINRFSFEKPHIHIRGDGKWHAISDEFFSEFDIDLHADKLSNMLNTFDYYDEAIKGGKTNINLKAIWPGSPMNFGLVNLNGSMNLDIKSGRFLDLEPKAGRIFGLLSIQALPRRLSLDFSDLFKKGFTFDSIHGNFTLEDGNAYTNDLTMEGPAALITVTGRTGLVAQDYDQTVTVIPQVSDSLPVAGALFGPIGIGVGAVIFLTGKMFEAIPEQIDKLLGFQYSVKGNWKDPVIKPLEQDKTAEQPVLGGQTN